MTHDMRATLFRAHFIYRRFNNK